MRNGASRGRLAPRSNEQPPSIRHAPSRASLSKHRSTTSLRHSPPPPQPISLSGPIHDDDEDDRAVGDAAGGSARFSLAHELAAALMPEPSASSKLLADELGIEFDEGAEGIEEAVPHLETTVLDNSSVPGSLAVDDRSMQSEDDSTTGYRSQAPSTIDTDEQSTNEALIETPPSRRRAARLFSTPPSKLSQSVTTKDPLDQFSEELAATDAFITRLRHLDSDFSSSSSFPATPSASTSSEPPVERYTARIIRQLNDSAREREGQVRELVAIEKEFRRIGGEVGGGDVLASLDALEEIEGLMDHNDKGREGPSGGHLQPLGNINEDDEDLADADESSEGEVDTEDVFGSGIPPSQLRSPKATSHPRRSASSVTPNSTLPHLAHMRSATSSLVNSLSTISEHAQEASAATADAGRRIRAVKNRITSIRNDWESAERSREKIELWEGRGEGAGSQLIDGRKIVEEQLNAFAIVLAEAAVKTQAIMAAA